MRLVKDLIAELQRFPPDARCYAYEGEITGVVVTEVEYTTNREGGRGRRELGWVTCSESDRKEDETVIHGTEGDE